MPKNSSLPAPTAPAAPGALAALVSLVFLASGLLGCGNAGTEAAVMTGSERQPAAAAERPLEVETLRLEPQSVEDRAVLPADLLPLRRATLATELAGVVKRIHADAGERVAAGEVLLEIDTEALENQLAEARAVHRQRLAQFQRAEALLERRSITQQQYLDALTQRDVAATGLAQAELQLRKSRLEAPWDGTVAERHLEEGDYAQPGQPAFEVVESSRLKVLAPAPASDVPDLREGLPAEVRIDVFPGRVFEGRITRLGALLDPGARTLDVEVEIANPAASGGGRLLKPGLAARLSIPLRNLEAALVVPLDALLDLGEEDAVFVAARGEDGELRAERRTVEVGRLLAGDRAVIVSGLEAGDEVLVKGQKQVSPGQLIATPTP